MLADAAALERDLVDSRARAMRVTADLDGERLLGPKLAIVNPPLWEIGHVAWFQERWCLRQRADGSLADSILPGADALYDSSAVAHDTRWDLPLPGLKATRAYGDKVLERVRERLAREPENEALQYFVRLATFHEDMHAEAFHYTRQTLGYAGLDSSISVSSDRRSGMISKWPAGHSCSAQGRTAVSCSTTRNGRTKSRSRRSALPAPWSPTRSTSLTSNPAARRRATGKKRAAPGCSGASTAGCRLCRSEPMRHVSWNEAQALLRLGEAAPADRGRMGVRQFPRWTMAQVWEWTASTFDPYPGFVRDPYKEYSEPWFGTHKVLRGGSFAAPARLLRPTFRNFYTPDRGDVFCGFRTCALG